MKYGVCDMSDEQSLAILSQKGVPATNCFPSDDLSPLVVRVTDEDTVFINDPTCFVSVTQLLAFVEVCHTRMTSVHFIKAPYLDFGRSRRWKGSMIRFGNVMLGIQQNAKAYMRKCFRLSNEQWKYVDFCIEKMSLLMISAVFAKDGIMGRK